MLDTDYRQIQDLARSGRSPNEFVCAFVESFARMAGAELGIAWDCKLQPFQPLCQVLRDPEAMVKLPLSSQRHEEILNEANESRKAMIVTPPIEAGTPMPAVLVSPLRRGDLNALVEFILPLENSEETNRAVFVALADCCRIADDPTAQSSGTVTTASTKSEPSRRLTDSSLDEFTQQIHRSLDLNETANTIANEARRILDCDRVTVFRKQGRALTTFAISGQPIVNHRSNTVKALHKLVTSVLKMERPFWCPTDEELPEQIRQSLDEYVDLSMSKSMAILPIFDCDLDKDRDPELREKRKPRMIGGIAVEQANEQWDRTRVASNIEKVTRHASLAYRNAHDVSGMFLYPVWRTLGKTRAVTTARGIKKTLLCLLAAVGLILAMLFVPATFNLGCEGTLLPVERQRVFADQAGMVQRISVKHGSDVMAGDKLLVMQNDELEIQIEQITGELNTLRERRLGGRSIRITNEGRAEGRSEQTSQREIQTQIASLGKRLKTLEEKKTRLAVASPIDGQVLTWDLANLLKDRPVQQGDLLLEVANTKGEWELALDVADRKVGHLLRAIDKADSDGDGPLIVRFTMAAEPQRAFVGTVREIAHATSVNADRMQMVRVKVDVEEKDLDKLKYVGSTVNAKIDCGTRTLGFVWLHDAWEFVQYQVLFRIW